MILSKQNNELKDIHHNGKKANVAKLVDKAVFPGMQGGPLEHVIAAKAICFMEAQQQDFIETQKQTVTNAQVLANKLMQNGFELVSGGTDNHLILMDLSNKHITGAQAERALELAGIHVNKNMVPFDTRSPMDHQEFVWEHQH